MTEPESLVLEHLRHLRAGQDALRADMLEVKERLGRIEEGNAHLEAGYASLSRRLDRMGERIGRIEERLGLVDAT